MASKASGAVSTTAPLSIWAWGWNHAGQLGDGTTVDRHLPGPVIGVTGPRWIAAGALHSLAGIA